MSSERLQHLVSELHKELEDHPLGGDDRDLLRQALGDILDHLGAEDEPLVPSALDTLHEMQARFAEEHPALATGLSRLVDQLNRSGF